jgi:hypothetical protein
MRTVSVDFSTTTRSSESSNVQTYPSHGARPVSVRVEVLSEDLVVVEKSTETVRMRFRGAQAEIYRLQQAISEGVTLRPDINEPGTHNLVLENLLPQTSPLSRVAVSILTIEPRTLQVKVDRLVRREAGLHFEPEDVELKHQARQASPSRVMLSLPERELEHLGDPGSPRLTLEPMVDLRSLPTGTPQTVRARVRLPEALAEHPDVRVEPREVELSFTIDKKEDAYTLPSVPVWVAAPPGDLTTYQVELHEDSRVLRDVTVTGPAGLIERVADREIRVIALLRLSSDDLAQNVGQETEEAVSFDLPPQLTIREADRTVRFTVSRRDN